MARPLIGTRIASVYELQAEWLEPRLTDLGISWTSFQLLTTVANAKEEASQIEVARRMGVTAATLSESVQNHVQKGLLKQSQSPKDKRVKILSLTEKSERTIREIRELVVESEEVMAKGILPHELSSTVRVLDRIRKNLTISGDIEP